MFSKYLLLIRPHHWVKNLLIFFPLLLSHNEYYSYDIINSLYVFISFCLVSSGVYIFNDIKDAKYDIINSRTKNRPIASGKISVKVGYLLSIVFVVFSILILTLFVPECLFLIFLYIIINILYSVYLKYIVFADVIAVSSGFLIRILIGGLATGIDQSLWTLLIVCFASISLATGKRLGQIVENPKYLAAEWNYKLLKNTLYISVVFTIIFYGLFSIDSDVATRHESNIIWISFPIIVSIFLRYLYIACNGLYLGDPTDSILKDKILQIMVFIWCIIIFLIFVI